jgi:hypothetical protein
MCEETERTAEHTPPAVAVEAQVEQLQQQVAAIQRELVELRMSQRKALLEELAGLERPLVEQGVIAERTRPPRHK